MTLIDTSAWVEFFRGRRPTADRIDLLLDNNQVALCGPVLTELRRGFRSEKERSRVLSLFEGCHWLEGPSELWAEAGDLGFLLARKGVVVKTLDLLIAVHALAHSCALLSLDRDFRAMARAGVPLIVES